MNGITQGRDVGPRRLKPARLSNVKLAPGPDGLPVGSFKFQGLRDSYILFPNKGKLDTKNSITITAWVYPKSSGPLFHYLPSGVRLWLINPRTLYARFVPRSKRPIR